MNIPENADWNWVGNDYTTAFIPTDDPRVVAVIQRDDHWDDPIDGDCYCPAFYYDRMRGGLTAAGSTYTDGESDEIASRIEQARDHFQWRRLPWATVERYARVFHGTTMRQVSSSIDRDAQVILFNTPTWREHVGITEDQDYLSDDFLDGEAESWQAALDGEVYSIGYAVSDGRVLDDGEEIDLEDGNWEIVIECGGFLGEKYAQESAAAFEYGEPSLPEMLEVGA